MSGANRARLATAAWTLAVLCLTLYPATPTHVRISPYCLGCGEYATVDALVNIALFVPLGFFAALGWPGQSRTALFAAALSLSIEITQHQLIPGRFGSAQDFLTNSLGAIAGVAFARALPSLSQLSRGRRWAALILTTATATMVVWLTPLLLQPSISRVELWGQIAPQKHRDFAPFRGTVSAVTFNGIAIPYGQLSPLEPNDPFHSHIPTMTVQGISALPSPRITALARLITPWNEQAMIAERNGRLIFRVRQRSRELRLRQPFAGFDSILPPAGTPFVITARLLHDRWAVVVTTPTSADSAQLPLSVGLGWSFFVPWNQPLTSQADYVNAAWLALLALTVFLAALPVSRRAALGAWSWFLIAGVYLSGMWWHLESPSVVEWLGPLAGAVIGFTAYPKLRRTLLHHSR